MKRQKKDFDKNLYDNYYQKDDEIKVGDSILNDDLEKRISLNNAYSYFNFVKIRKALKLNKTTEQQGDSIFKSDKLQVLDFSTGYLMGTEALASKICTRIKDGYTEVICDVVIERDDWEYVRCSCKDCGRKYYYWNDNWDCKYVAASLEQLEYEIKKQNIGDSTDILGSSLLDSFYHSKSVEVAANITKNEQSIRLEPRIIKQYDSLDISFKIGTGKMYIIKNMRELIDHIHNCETVAYGKSEPFNHQMDNFVENDRKWIKFIEKAIGEENKIVNRLGNSSSMDYRNPLKYTTSMLELYGWRLDTVYNYISEEPCEFVDKTVEKSPKAKLSTAVNIPKLAMKIEPMDDKGDFDGIVAECKVPSMYKGENDVYFLDQSTLMKTDIEDIKPIEFFLNKAKYNTLTFSVGRRRLEEFYYDLLPKLEEYIDIEDSCRGEVDKYLLPEVNFMFYLDASNNDITCRAVSQYGDKEYSTFDFLEQKNEKTISSFRMENRECEVIANLNKYFSEYDEQEDCLYCEGDENTIYTFMKDGIEDIARYGEVLATDAFKKLNVRKQVKVSIGVSVSNGLLDLQIESDEMDKKTLLELLDSYRKKKKYHRLKNGDFINLDDENIKNLDEMLDTMNISSKEFLKEHIKVPAYRTLYLDKMLENWESLYSSRDKHYNQLIKNFKTVNESDFEVPACLETTMRDYQKKGFKWIKMLEKYGFGGILADDMGLGKTLQTIAVLLSTKEENNEKNRPSLIVTPASLVYNWKEEISRFAPSLKAETVTGSQSERKSMIEQYENVDVLITSYDLLKRDITMYEDKEFQYQVIDEAQYIKNQSTSAAKSVKVIKSKSRLALTGTPIENKLSELWSIFDYLMPGFLYKYETFKKEIETLIVKKGDEDATARLQKMIAPFVLRRLKKDVLKDLPEKMEEVQHIVLDGNQRKLYDAQVVNMRQTLEMQSNEEFKKQKLQILAELTKLRQICCEPKLCFDNYSSESAKLDMCVDLVKRAVDGGHKVLLFSQFTSMFAFLEKRFSDEEISYYKIVGQTSKEERSKLVKSFNEDHTNVFLISLKAGGVGLNLVGADIVIHYDPWWNIAAENQASDRAHRIGQKNSVTVYKLIAKNTIEEKILKLQEQKRDLADKIINGEGGQLGSMTKDELLELLK